ncbi:MAG TPA: class I SAM-dependent methyltransferase [Planctomycetota bacterium]|nr:class I SAM-dependent methyltransferase [Planctomycetota bacterium]
MRRTHQVDFIRHYAPPLSGPYLEVGSKDHGSAKDLKPLFDDSRDWVGVDIEAGAGVDLVCDLAADFATVDAALGGRRFGTVFCFSTLEHCRQPFRMAENLTRLLTPGGHLVLSVPFAFKFHGFPSDYWRFTPEGVKVLFPGLAFDAAHAAAATSQPGEFLPVTDDLGRIRFSADVQRKAGHPVRAVSAGLLKLLGRLGVWRWFTRYRYLLVPTNVFMVGRKPD